MVNIRCGKTWPDQRRAPLPPHWRQLEVFATSASGNDTIPLATFRSGTSIGKGSSIPPSRRFPRATRSRPSQPMTTRRTTRSTPAARHRMWYTGTTPKTRCSLSSWITSPIRRAMKISRWNTTALRHRSAGPCRPTRFPAAQSEPGASANPGRSVVHRPQLVRGGSRWPGADRRGLPFRNSAST